MKDDDLKKQLKNLSIPPEEDEARERALDRAMVAFRNQPLGDEILNGGKQTIAWKWVTAGIALALIMIGLVWHQGTDHTESRDLMILGQVTELFPQTLEAIVERNGQVDVQLARDEVQLSHQPLMVIFKKGSEVLKVLSFSGREICIELNGRDVCMEVLAQENGDVIIAGKDFLWSRQHPVILNGFRVEARSLETTL